MENQRDPHKKDQKENQRSGSKGQPKKQEDQRKGSQNPKR